MENWRIIYLILLGFVGLQSSGQSIVSENAGQKGYFARFGDPFATISTYRHLGVSNQNIETVVGGIFGGSTSPRLLINPQYQNSVVIGEYNNPTTALVISPPLSDPLSLHLTGNGRITSTGEITFQLDRDNNEDTYFIVRESTGADIFWIGENSNHFIKGDLFVDGTVTVESVDTFYKVIENVDFEIVDSQGDELDLGYSYVRADGHDGLFPEVQLIRANLDLPNGSILHEVQYQYLDLEPDGAIGASLYRCGIRHDIPSPHPEGYSNPTPTLVIYSFGQVINANCNNYISFGGDGGGIVDDRWAGQRIFPIRLKYTLPSQ